MPRTTYGGISAIVEAAGVRRCTASPRSSASAAKPRASSFRGRSNSPTTRLTSVFSFAVKRNRPADSTFVPVPVASADPSVPKTGLPDESKSWTRPVTWSPSMLRVTRTVEAVPKPESPA